MVLVVKRETFVMVVLGEECVLRGKETVLLWSWKALRRRDVVIGQQKGKGVFQGSKES